MKKTIFVVGAGRGLGNGVAEEFWKLYTQRGTNEIVH